MLRFNIQLNTIDEIKKFINIANSIDHDIEIHSDRYIVDGKSILGIFSLDLTKEVMVVIEKISMTSKESDEIKDKFKEFIFNTYQ